MSDWIRAVVEKAERRGRDGRQERAEMRATALAKQKRAQTAHAMAIESVDAVFSKYNGLVPWDFLIRKTGDREWERGDTGSFRLILTHDAIVVFSSERAIDGTVAYDRRIFQIGADGSNATVVERLKARVPITDPAALGRLLTESWLSRLPINSMEAAGPPRTTRRPS
jgi:hypothetical protein